MAWSVYFNDLKREFGVSHPRDSQTQSSSSDDAASFLRFGGALAGDLSFDAGLPLDAGLPFEAGLELSLDAGLPLDAGLSFFDAGLPFDAGLLFFAGWGVS